MQAGRYHNLAIDISMGGRSTDWEEELFLKLQMGSSPLAKSRKVITVGLGLPKHSTLAVEG